jgi:hypothetical protein
MTGLPYFANCKLCGTDISFARNHPCIPADSGGCSPPKWEGRLCIPCRERRRQGRAAKRKQALMCYLAKGRIRIQISKGIPEEIKCWLQDFALVRMGWIGWPKDD